MFIILNQLQPHKFNQSFEIFIPVLPSLKMQPYLKSLYFPTILSIEPGVSEANTSLLYTTASIQLILSLSHPILPSWEMRSYLKIHKSICFSMKVCFFFYFSIGPSAGEVIIVLKQLQANIIIVLNNDKCMLAWGSFFLG